MTAFVVCVYALLLLALFFDNIRLKMSSNMKQNI